MIDLKRLVPDYISRLKPYQPGKPIEEVEREYGIKDSIKLASNENPMGPSPASIEALRVYIDKLNLYPDGGGFYLSKAIAQEFGVDIENIVLGNGSCEIIENLCKMILTPNDSVMITDLTFIIYKLASMMENAEIINVPLNNLRYNLKAMFSAIKDNTKIIFFANPNNPTGTYFTSEEFDEFMSKVPEHILIVMDEAYYEYVSAKDFPDSFKYFREGRNIIILRTFSKIHGLAGLRIGYGFAPKELITSMNKVRSPFNTSSLAQVAALAALGDKDHVKKSVNNNFEGYEYITKHFDRMGIKYAPSQANFIFFETGKDAGFVYESLIKNGIITRPMAGWGNPNALRVTIGTLEECKKFINAMEKII